MDPTLAVAVLDASGVVRYLNPAAEAFYGWTAGEVVGKSALALGVAPSDTAAAVDLFKRLESGQTWTGRFPITRSDRTRVDTWLTVVAVPDPHGDQPLLLTVAGDARALHLEPEPEPTRLAAEDRAEEANLLLEAMLHSVPVGMAFFDHRLRYVRVNAALAQISGLPPDAHVGRDVRELRPDLPIEVADDIRHVFATGETIEQRTVTWQAVDAEDDRPPRHWMVSYYPIERGGEVLWVGTTVVDVTEWRNAEAERAHLLEAERSARQAAERAAERLARLQIVTGRLAEAGDMETVAEVVVSHGSEGVGAAGGAMCVIEGTTLRVVRSHGLTPAMLGAGNGGIELDADLPLTDAIRRGEVILLRSLSERDRLYPTMVGVQALNRSFAAVPMMVEGRAVGCIVFGWPEEREFTQGEPGFLLALGRQAAQAIERSRLYAAERQARADAEQAWQRMRFLADASRVLSSSLDHEVTLRDLTRLVVAEVADSCMIHVVENDDLRLVAVAHVDAVEEKRLARLAGESSRGRPPVLLGRAIVTGEALVLPTITDALWQQVARDDEHLAQLRALDVQSCIVVPLRVQGRVIGVLALGSTSADRRYERSDLPFVEDLAGRAAVAIENSRAHTAHREVAETLQRSLLPPHLPRIPGLELAQRYHSMGALEVGGDFFDVFPAGDGRWGVVMGDVCGKGVAAASLTALARYTVRAGAIDEAEAGQVLRLLNRAILDSDADERFCTIVYATVEPGLTPASGTRVTLACGGHPFPLLLGADGIVRPVGEPGTAIGLFEEVDIREVEVTMWPGDALVLYTDGLVEVRSPSGDFDPELLARALAGAAGRSAEGIAEAVDSAVHDFEGGRQRDDMALLILKAPST